MKEVFCKECGTPLASDLSFCPSCGTPIDKVDATVATGPTRSADKKEPMSKKSKVLVGSLAALFILLIGAHFVLLSLTDSKKQLSHIYNAIIDENGDAFFAQLTVADDVIYDSDSFTKSFNTSALANLHVDLTDSVQQVTETGLTEIVKDDKGIEVFRIKRENFLFFYPKVTIEPIGQKLVINSDLENATLTIAGEEVKLAGKLVILNKVLPDNYTVDLKGENTYFESVGTIKIDRSLFSESAELKLLATDYSIQFSGEPAESTVYVNDVSTEKTIKELGTISPVFGNKTEFHAVRQVSEGKTENSDKTVAEPGETTTFSFPLLASAEAETKAKEDKEKETAEQSKEDAAQIRLASIVYNDFRDDYELGLNYQDFGYIEPYLYASGKAYNELRKFIAETDDTYFSYNFITNEVTEGAVVEDEVRLQVLETFTFENHLGQTTKYERKKEYVLVEVSPENFEIVAINITDTNRNKH